MAVTDVPELSPRERNEHLHRHSRAALHECARIYDAPLTGWRQTADGAPIPLNGFHWSISHKRWMVAAAIGRGPIGIDVERIQPRREDLFKAVASEAEWELMGGKTWANFFRLWTAKEAMLKANGLGIGYLGKCGAIKVIDESKMMTLFGNDLWHVEHFLWDEHFAAVASKGARIEWKQMGPGGSGAPGPMALSGK